MRLGEEGLTVIYSTALACLSVIVTLSVSGAGAQFAAGRALGCSKGALQMRNAI